MITDIKGNINIARPKGDPCHRPYLFLIVHCTDKRDADMKLKAEFQIRYINDIYQLVAKVNDSHDVILKYIASSKAKLFIQGWLSFVNEITGYYLESVYIFPDGTDGRQETFISTHYLDIQLPDFEEREP